MHNKDKILIEMSGGLDSSVAALLLQEQGYEVIGVMMKFMNNQTFNNDENSAKEVSKQLNIEFKTIDLQNKFKSEVIDYFIDTYKQAKTPNPCIICNKAMKFGAIFDVANDLGCKKIATGHYAQIKFENDTYSLHRGLDKSKDQSYVLHFLNQEILSRIIFPLGKYNKSEIKKIAEDTGLFCTEKPESMDICFTEGSDYSKFIFNNSNYKAEPGNVVDTKGNIIGNHNGLINYTIGQRKGLGISGGEPLYVLSLNKTKNEVVLGHKDETISNEVLVQNFNWISGAAPSAKFKCQAKLRYRQQPQDCIVSCDGNNVKLHYPEGISSVTPGQFAVLYDNDKVLGGGTIVL